MKLLAGILGWLLGATAWGGLPRDIGAAVANASVTVNSQAAYQRGEYFHLALALANSNSPVWQTVTVTATDASGSTNQTGQVALDPTPQVFAYDADGNLTNDGRWTYAWNEVNGLTNLTSLPTVTDAARRRLEFAYDTFGRRVKKVVSTWNGSSYVPQSTNRFVYDGWLLLAEVNSANAPVRSYLWGLDVSGTREGAGGIGGLLSLTVHTGSNAGTYYYAHDGNGNVAALVNAANGQVVAAYEYGPYGELLRASGPLARENPFRFSTKYQDDETDLVYFGQRYYSASFGRWLNRDPIEEAGGLNLYAFVNNDPVNQVDAWGLEPTLNDLFWLNAYENWRQDAGRFARRAGNDVAGMAAGMLEHEYQTMAKGPLWSQLEAARDFLDSVGRLGAEAGRLSADRCARQRLWQDLGEHFASPEGIADATLFVESLLAGKLARAGLGVAEEGSVRVFSSQGTLEGGRISLEEALAAARRNGIDTRMFKLEYAGADPRYRGHTSFTPTDLTFKSFKVVRVSDGRAIIKLYDNGLTSERAAVETIAHEINHIRGVFKAGVYTSEEVAEAAARAAGQHFR